MPTINQLVRKGRTRIKKKTNTPHLGSATLEARTEMTFVVAKNVIAFLEGRAPPNRVV